MNYDEQIHLENKFSKQYANNLVKEFFKCHKDNEVVVTLYSELNKVVHDVDVVEVIVDVLTTVAMIGRASFQQVIASTVHHFNEEDYVDNLALTANVLAIIEASGLITISTSRRMFELKFVELSFELSDYVMKIIGNCAYLPPTIVPCIPKSNSDAGWKTFKKSVFLNKNHHEGNAPLHWLEVLNSTAFSIDLNMLNYDEQVDIDIQQDKKKLDNFLGQRELTIRSIKEVLAHGNKFYFVHRFCARYRAYAAGYALSPQGNDYRKSLLNLNKQEMLKEEYNF